MRVYIAGPMTGLPESNYPAFNAAAAAWRAHGWDVVNPAESFDGDATQPYLTYCLHDVELLKTCDAIAMLPGWSSPSARGSMWEYAIANVLLGLLTFNANQPVPATDFKPKEK